MEKPVESSGISLTLVGFTGSGADGYYISSLTDALLESEHIGEISVLVPESSRNLHYLDESISLHTFPFPKGLLGVGAKTFDPFFVRQMQNMISSTDADLVHLIDEMRVPVSSVLTILRNWPLVVTVHEPNAYVPTPLRTLLLNPIQNLSSTLISRLADHVFVHGKHSKRILVDRGVSASAISVIPHGSFYPYFSVDSGPRTDNSIDVLYFGRIFPGKGVETLVQAGHLLAEDNPTITITIAGSGSIDPYLDDIGASSMFDVRNRYLSEEEAGLLFESASVVVLPYSDGSQSGIISIAGGFETPVVVTDVGNFSEMVVDGETGYVVPPDDPGALADAMSRLLDDEMLRQEMGANARCLVESEFNWRSIASKHVAVYRTL